MQGLSHLTYANGILIFSKANPKSLNSIKGIFGVFSKFSSLDVMLTMKRAVHTHLQGIIGFPSKPLPLTYLGIPHLR